MRPVTVVSDSTHYLPAEDIARYGVRVVSLYVTWNGEVTRESELPGFDPFYAYLRDSGEFPTTSQPSPGDFLAVYEELAAQGHDIVSVHLSGGISGTVESARQAAADVTGVRVEVVDSGSCAGGLALVVYAAIAAAQAGLDVDAVAERARQGAEQHQIYFCVDDLEYLHRGGRIGRAQAWIGSALAVKPILSFSDGILEPVERVRTRRKMVERMTQHLAEFGETGRGAWLVQHVQAPDLAAELVARGTELLGREPLMVTEVGPVLGSYSGPGMLGVGGIPPALVD